jgi:hypothetical protein
VETAVVKDTGLAQYCSFHYCSLHVHMLAHVGWDKRNTVATSLPACCTPIYYCTEAQLQAEHATKKHAAMCSQLTSLQHSVSLSDALLRMQSA